MANNFSGDANCVALWRFENDYTDSKGNNDLTNSGMVINSTTYKEGSYSVQADGLTDVASIADASLDAGFPLKNGGSGTFSICEWFYVNAFPASGIRYLLGKVAADKLSFALRFEKGTNYTFRLKIGYNGGASWEDIDHGSTIQTGRWYHAGVTFNNTTKAYKIRIWDDTAGALLGGAEVSGTATNNINVEDAPFHIGCSPGDSLSCGCQQDEVVVFKDILTSDEIDQVRAGTYGASTTTSSTTSTTSSTSTTATTSSTSSTATASTTSSTTSSTSSTATASTTSSSTSTTATASTTSSTTSSTTTSATASTTSSTTATASTTSSTATASTTSSTTATASSTSSTATGSTTSSTTSSTSSSTTSSTTTAFDEEGEINDLKNRMDAVEAKLADHENRITALETGQRLVMNVYDRTPSQGATGGTKNTSPVKRVGGVYPRRHG